MSDMITAAKTSADPRSSRRITSRSQGSPAKAEEHRRWRTPTGRRAALSSRSSTSDQHCDALVKSYTPPQMSSSAREGRARSRQGIEREVEAVSPPGVKGELRADRRLSLRMPPDPQCGRRCCPSRQPVPGLSSWSACAVQLLYGNGDQPSWARPLLPSAPMAKYAMTLGLMALVSVGVAASPSLADASIAALARRSLPPSRRPGVSRRRKRAAALVELRLADDALRSCLRDEAAGGSLIAGHGRRPRRIDSTELAFGGTLRGPRVRSLRNARPG